MPKIVSLADLMMTINSEHFEEICNSVWRDRALVLLGRGFLTGEAALMRAVYWRVSKAGIKAVLSSENYGSPQAASSYQLAVNCLLEVHAHPRFNGAQFLKELIQRYKNELSEN